MVTSELQNWLKFNVFFLQYQKWLVGNFDLEDENDVGQLMKRMQKAYVLMWYNRKLPKKFGTNSAKGGQFVHLVKMR